MLAKLLNSSPKEPKSKGMAMYYKNFCLVRKLVDVDALESVVSLADRGRSTASAKELEIGVFANQMCIFATHKTKFATSTRFRTSSSTYNAIPLFVSSFCQLQLHVCVWVFVCIRERTIFIYTKNSKEPKVDWAGERVGECGREGGGEWIDLTFACIIRCCSWAMAFFNTIIHLLLLLLDRTCCSYIDECPFFAHPIWNAITAQRNAAPHSEPLSTKLNIWLCSFSGSFYFILFLWINQKALWFMAHMDSHMYNM